MTDRWTIEIEIHAYCWYATILPINNDDNINGIHLLGVCYGSTLKDIAKHLHILILNLLRTPQGRYYHLHFSGGELRFTVFHKCLKLTSDNTKSQTQVNLVPRLVVSPLCQASWMQKEINALVREARE